MDEESGSRPGDKMIPGETNEGVRIIGAEEAAEAMERGDVAARRTGAQPRYGDRPKGPPAGPRPALRFPLDARSDPTQIEKRAVRPSESTPSKPVSGPVEMPHWTEPATGEVPKVVIGNNPERADDLDAWSSFATSSPRWRDQQDSEWDDSGFEDPAALGGDDTRIGALDTTDRPTHEELFSFDELESFRPEEPVEPAPPAKPRRSLFGRIVPERIHPDPENSGDDELVTGPPVEPTPAEEPSSVAAVAASAPEDGPGRGGLSRRLRRASAPPPLPDPQEGVTSSSVGPEPPPLGDEDFAPAATAARASDDGDSVVFDPKFDPERAYAEEPAAARASVRQRISSRNVPDSEPDNGGPPSVENKGGDGQSRNFRAAILVGAVLALVALVAFALGPWAVVGLVAFLLVLCGGEYFTAMRHVGYEPIALLGLLAIVGMPLAAYWRGEAALPLVLVLTLVAALLWYVVGAGGQGRPTDGIGVTIFGVTWIGLFGAYAAVMLRLPHGRGMLGAAVIATVVNDVGALIAGRALGNRPLSAASPNKTVEGLVGAGIITVVVMGLLGAFPGIKPFDTFGNGLALGAVVAVMAPLGDLCQSVIKRDLEVKDMGTFLPGHGGVFDRFDAMLFVLPATYYLLHVLNVL